MAGFLKEGERILKKIMEVGIEQLEYYYAIDLELHRNVKDVYQDVYGSHAGGKTSLIAEFTGVVVSDDIFGSDSGYSGNFQEGFLYTSDQRPLVNDVVQIVSDDNKIRRFKIISIETFGTQTEVLSRYKLSNLGD